MTSWPAVLAILGMAAITLLIKAGGLLLAGRLPATGFAAAFLRHIPGAVLASLIAPAVLTGGIAEWVGCAVTVVLHLVSRSLFLAMAGGVLAVYLARTWLAM